MKSLIIFVMLNQNHHILNTLKNPDMNITSERIGAVSVMMPLSNSKSGFYIMKEVWKDILDFKGFYQVSNYGRIRSIDRKVKQHRGCKYQLKKGKVLSPATNKFGYIFCALSRNNELKSVRIHRLVGVAFIRNPKNKPCINHKNGIKADNRAENLEWVTHQENTIHSFKIGLSKPKKSIDVHFAKINHKIVKEIREFYATKTYSQATIASMYNLSQTNISCIVNYKTWKN